jgi:ribonucleoside-triphosphate reductase
MAEYTMKVKKRDGSEEQFDYNKIINAAKKAYTACGKKMSKEVRNDLKALFTNRDIVDIEEIQDSVEGILMKDNAELAKAFILYRDKRKRIREFVQQKTEFIHRYKESSNTANATVDDNSNVGGKNIGILNAEIHKEDNINISRGMVMNKLKELYPNFDAKQYERDLKDHIIYKHDESSFAGAIAPYCCSITMYPFLSEGIRSIGGLSAQPKNLDSFCGMYVNLIFATSAMFAGAVATSEFLLYFAYFAKKEWGEDFWQHPDMVVSANCSREKTIRKQIHQYFQQVIYSINQPAAARGLQSAFINFSYFDKPFFEGMFGEFVFPDMTKPDWESLNWIQREFMQWFNQERLRTILTFPVESFALVYKDGKFVDEESARFVAEEYARGHSFFTYISDTVDSLSSCCRLKNIVTTKEFNFTNGNMGVQTGSKSVITLNLNRIMQDFMESVTIETSKLNKNGLEEEVNRHMDKSIPEDRVLFADSWIAGNLKQGFKEYLINILERVYKYHTAYNELLWDMYNAGLLPVYTAGFINLNKQYLTIGINGLNQAAEFLGIECRDNPEYQAFCQFIFSTIKEQNTLHKTAKTTYNTEEVPAESLAIKNYNWDKEDGYFVGEGNNLYASYIFKPDDVNTSVLEKFRLHGKDYIGDYLDGGAAAHIGLDQHLSEEQYWKLLHYAAEVGCQYFTFNIPNCECEDCHFIAKQPFEKCPKCGSTNISLWDRVIGYLTKIKNWSTGRQIEQKTRVYTPKEQIDAQIL